jgi:cell division protein FtsZ
MVLHLSIPQTTHTDFTPHITVIGVGGGGTNAVDNMIASNLQGVEFVVANTDAQQLVHSRADRRIQLGPHITQGLGAGAKPEIGRAAAEEAAEELYRHLDGAHMVFITAGMGGGTGTGAAPVIARMARERNILTVGVVTKPFTFEGARRARAADAGIEELQQYVDTLIVIPNQNLFRLANERTGWKEAFKMADNVLYMGVRGVTDLMVAPGLVNLDFADIRTVMAEMGKAMMGTGEAEGENRAVRAAEIAISNPLLEDTSMAGARGLLINITGGEDMTLFEVDQAANRIREEVDEEANIIFGSAIDDNLHGKVRVSVVATGIESAQRGTERPRLAVVGGVSTVAMPAAMAAAVAAQQAEPAAPVSLAPGAAPAPQPASLAWGQTGPQLRAAAVPLPAAPAAAPTARPALPLTRLQQVAAQHAAAQQAAAQQAAAQQASAQQAAQQAASRPQPEPAPAPEMEAEEPRPARAARAGHPRGLFAEPKRAEAPAAPRKTLFGIVTGAIRGGAAAVTAPDPAPELEPRAEPSLVRAAPEDHPRVRQTSGDEIGLEIPAFLRRQSS